MRRTNKVPSLWGILFFKTFVQGPTTARPREDVNQFRDMDPAAAVIAAWTAPGDSRRRSIRRNMPALANQLDRLAADHHRQRWQHKGLIR